jgi:hypothetical protein
MVEGLGAAKAAQPVPTQGYLSLDFLGQFFSLRVFSTGSHGIFLYGQTLLTRLKNVWQKLGTAYYRHQW